MNQLAEMWLRDEADPRVHGTVKEVVRERFEREAPALRALPAVSDGPVGLIGYSRGAFLAVSVAGSTPGVEAVVDFYGGGGGGTDTLEDEVRAFPPVLILHGDADDVVPVRFAYALRDAVVAENGQAEIHVYSDVGHAFNAPYSSTYSESAAQDAFGRTVAFLRRHLGR